MSKDKTGKSLREIEYEIEHGLRVLREHRQHLERAQEYFRAFERTYGNDKFRLLFDHAAIDILLRDYMREGLSVELAAKILRSNVDFVAKQIRKEGKQ